MTAASQRTLPSGGFVEIVAPSGQGFIVNLAQVRRITYRYAPPDEGGTTITIVYANGDTDILKTTAYRLDALLGELVGPPHLEESA